MKDLTELCEGVQCDGWVITDCGDIHRCPCTPLSVDEIVGSFQPWTPDDIFQDDNLPW